MKRPRSSRWVERIRQLPRRFASRALILVYHRIDEPRSDPWGMCVAPQNFTQHLAMLRDHFEVLSLHQLVEAHRRSALPHRAVAVTFDDGYADNSYRARATLQEHGIPATFFLTTGYLDEDKEFWWDELEKYILQSGRLPASLVLRIDGADCEWSLGSAVDYGETEREQSRDLRPWEGTPTSRLSLYYSVWQRLLPLAHAPRQAILAEIATWSGSSTATRPTHRTLSKDELHELSKGDLVEIGGHTVTHSCLPTHPAAMQREEIERNKHELEGIIGRPVESFSYPHGERSRTTEQLVREAGFTCGCTTKGEPVWRASDRFRLPRVMIHDWDADVFVHQLSTWLA